MTSLIVDASVAVKWFIAEQDHDKALRLRTPEVTRIAPELVVAEIGNALWKRFHRKMLSADDVRVLAPLLHRPFHRLSPLSDLLEEATNVAIDLHHPLYDCFYLALALREGAPLVTADARLLDAARKAGIEALAL